MAHHVYQLLIQRIAMAPSALSRRNTTLDSRCWPALVAATQLTIV